MKAWTPVIATALLATAAASADECSEFRDRVDTAIAAEGYDAVVDAFDEAIDAWKIVEESNRWNPGADSLVPALVASKESADAASDARDRVLELGTRATGTDDRELADVSVNMLDDLYHKTMIAFFELIVFAHCGDLSR